MYQENFIYKNLEINKTGAMLTGYGFNEITVIYQVWTRKTPEKDLVFEEYIENLKDNMSDYVLLSETKETRRKPIINIEEFGGDLRRIYKDTGKQLIFRLMVTPGAEIRNLFKN